MILFTREHKNEANHYSQVSLRSQLDCTTGSMEVLYAGALKFFSKKEK